MPSFQRSREIQVGEILIEARRLRLLMEAWQAYRDREFETAAGLLSELAFARRFDAHWFYWPPPLWRDTEDDQASVTHWRAFLEAQRMAGPVATQSIGKETVFRSLVAETHCVCAEPVSQVEITPGVSIENDALTLRWDLRPVRFLGEEDMGKHAIAHEEPFIGAPYGLMFLLDVTAGNETRVCADPFCRQIFGCTRRNQIFCSPSCAHRSAVRKSRKRRRERR